MTLRRMFLSKLIAQKITKPCSFILRTLCTRLDENKHEHFDVIIVGGGLVGTSLACAISKSKVTKDRKVILLEAAPRFKAFENNEYSNRVSAINNTAVDLLKSLDAWDTIVSRRYKPVKQIQVWDACSDARITFNHDNFSGNVAYIVENNLIQHALISELEKNNNTQIRYASKINDIKLYDHRTEHCEVRLKDGETLTCDLLIGADGQHSIVRKKMNVDTLALSYDQMGLVANVETEDSGENSVAWQRFLPNGPVALLPLNETLSSLVWTTTPTHARSLMNMTADEFVDALNNAFLKEYPQDPIVQNTYRMIESVFGNKSLQIRQFPPLVKSLKDKSRACFPLGFTHASAYVGNGVAIIGDAAHRIHPLAGQGANLGFADVQCLIKVLSDGIYAGNKLGNLNCLLKYERERLWSNVPILFGVHGLQILYNTTFSPIVALRSIGLQITDNISPIKKLFMEKAMG